MTNNFRVVVLAHVFPRALDDSMGAFLLHLADALAARGVTLEVIAPHAQNLANVELLGAARVQRFRYAPVHWETLAYHGTMHDIVGRGLVGKFLFALFTFAFLLKTISVTWSARPNLLHAHWWIPGGIVGAVASLVTRVPLIITTHGTDVEMLCKMPWVIPLARFAFGRARAITCGSNYLRDQLVALNVADAAKVVVIPMPLNPEFGIQKSKFGNRKSEILTVARLTKQKSIDTLVDALALLRDRGNDARLKIIGAGPERGALEAQTRRLNLSDCVEFVGALPQTELPAQYAACAVFVLPSIREGMGLVLAEALWCGAPVVAANSGGVTDIVRDGETGLLFPERDPRALAAAIEKLLRDQESARQLARTGAAFVRERFTPERVAAQFEKIYRSTTSSN